MCIENCQFENEYKNFITKYISNEEFNKLIFKLNEETYCLFHAPMEAILNTTLEEYKIFNGKTKNEIFYKNTFFTNDFYKISEELKNIFYNCIYYIISNITRKYYNCYKYDSISRISKRFEQIKTIINKYCLYNIDLSKICFPNGLVINKDEKLEKIRYVEYKQLLKLIKKNIPLPSISLYKCKINFGLKINNIKIIDLNISEAEIKGNFEFTGNHMVYYGGYAFVNFNVNNTNFNSKKIDIKKNILFNVSLNNINIINNEYSAFSFTSNTIRNDFNISFKDTKYIDYIDMSENKFGSKQENFYLQGTFNFSSKINTEIYFDKSEFYCAPNFNGTIFNDIVSFNDCKFFEINYRKYNYYRYLKNLMKNKDMDLEERFFWNLEQECKDSYGKQIKYKESKFENSEIEIALSQCYGEICSRGTNFYKIFASICESIIGFAILYYLLIPIENCNIINSSFYQYKICFYEGNFLDSLYKSISISYSFDVLKLEELRNNFILINIFYIIECIFNKILFIILAFMLRKRFKIEN